MAYSAELMNTRGLRLTVFLATIIISQASNGQGQSTTLDPGKPITDLIDARAKAPTADQVLARFVDAVGGKAAIDKVKTRVVEGTLEIPGMPAPAPMELRAKAPDKIWVKTEISGLGTSIEACDGQVAWSKSSAAGVREKMGDELAKAKRDSIFSEAMLKSVYPDIKFKETKKVGDADVYVLEAKPGKDRELFCFDVKSGLCVRRDSEFQINGTDLKTETTLEDYQAVDGVKEPFTVRVEIRAGDNPAGTMTFKCKSIKHNVAVDDAIFAKPEK